MEVFNARRLKALENKNDKVKALAKSMLEILTPGECSGIKHIKSA
jgi:hypothetical protein